MNLHLSPGGGRRVVLGGALLSALSACEAPPEPKAPPPAPALEAVAAPLSKQQLAQRGEQCARKSRDKFQRERRQEPAEFAYHYNAKLDTCFYLLTVSRERTVVRTLYDLNEGELYGEFQGPAASESPPKRTPDACRMVSFYCASGNEWQALAAYFMEE